MKLTRNIQIWGKNYCIISRWSFDQYSLYLFRLITFITVLSTIKFAKKWIFNQRVIQHWNFCPYIKILYKIEKVAPATQFAKRCLFWKFIPLAFDVKEISSKYLWFETNWLFETLYFCLIAAKQFLFSKAEQMVSWNYWVSSNAMVFYCIADNTVHKS